jgi:hypothetical protein
LTLLCSYHHRLLHEGAFKIEREADGALRYLRADGRVIPRGGYRLADLADDGSTTPHENPSGEGFCTTSVQGSVDEIRETAAVYRVTRLRPG